MFFHLGYQYDGDGIIGVAIVFENMGLNQNIICQLWENFPKTIR
jgi:hypothetical protein